jgi:5-methylcytosine-specific restriction endonuclease McrA
MKICSKCKIEKDKEKFNKSSKTKDGLHAWCRGCQKENNIKRANKPKFIVRYKACSKCEIKKDILEFYKSSSTKDGLQAFCKLCIKENDRQRKSQPKIMVIFKICSKCKTKKFSTEFHKCSGKKDGLSTYCKSCNMDIRRIYHLNNKEKENKNSNKHYFLNKDQHLQKSAKWRMRLLKGTIVKFSAAQLDQRMSVFGYKCAYCGGKFEHMDHVIPLSKGGPHCLANLRPSCAHCNLSKGSKKLSEWKKRVKYY